MLIFWLVISLPLGSLTLNSTSTTTDLGLAPSSSRQPNGTTLDPTTSSQHPTSSGATDKTTTTQPTSTATTELGNTTAEGADNLMDLARQSKKMCKTAQMNTKQRQFLRNRAERQRKRDNFDKLFLTSIVLSVVIGAVSISVFIYEFVDWWREDPEDAAARREAEKFHEEQRIHQSEVAVEDEDSVQ